MSASDNRAGTSPAVPPLQFVHHPIVPIGEVWFVDPVTGKMVGRIVNTQPKTGATT
jgi:hypothetical protein